MKRIGKPVFFIVFVIILALAYTSIFGVYGENGDFDVTYIKGIKDIRWGIDINGGVEAVFAPADGIDADETQMEDIKDLLDSVDLNTYGLRRTALGELTFEFRNVKQRCCRIKNLMTSANAIAAIRSYVPTVVATTNSDSPLAVQEVSA